MIRLDRIGLATYTNKPLDSMDFNAKEVLKPYHENFKNTSFERFFLHIFDSISI